MAAPPVPGHAAHPGTTSPAHLAENLAAGRIDLDPADQDAITALVPEG